MVRKYIPDTAKEFHANAHIQCAHADCATSAMHKVKTATGWAKFCDAHYDAYFTQQGIDNIDKYGMERQPDETRQEHVGRMRNFVRAGFKRLRAGSDRQAALAALIRDHGSDLGSQP